MGSLGEISGSPRKLALLLAQAAGRDSPSQGFANLIIAAEHFSQINLYLEIQYGKQITAEGAWPRQDLGVRACPHTWAPLS